MTSVEIRPGICGFIALVSASTEDGQHVDVEFQSDCPNLSRLNGGLGPFDAYSDLFQPLAKTEVFRQVASSQRHAACPVMSGILKAMEVAVGMALPRDASIVFVETLPE